MRSDARSNAKVALSSFKTLRLTSPAPVPLAVDGEPLPSATDIAVRVLPQALRVVR